MGPELRALIEELASWTRKHPLCALFIVAMLMWGHR